MIGAVVIDDDLNHIMGVSNALGEKGIASFPIHYSDAVRAKALCDGVSTSQPRVIITDIQILNDQQPEPTNKDFAAIAGLIERLIENLDGPYIVLAWTDKTDSFDKLKKYITDYFEKQEIQPPIYFDSICKTECKNSDGEFITEKIFSKLVAHLNEKKQIKALMNWEKNAVLSASNTVNTLFNYWGNDLESVLGCLAIAVAEKNLDGYEAEAINEAMSYIFKDEISKSNTDLESKNIWNLALSGIDYKSIESFRNKHKFQLNALLHIDFYVESNLVCPGDVWEVGEASKLFNSFAHPSETVGVIADFKNDLIESRVGPQNIMQAKSNLASAKKDSQKTKCKAKLVELRKKLRDTKRAIDSLAITAIEVSPQCDFSQKKKTLKTLHLGLLIPNEITIGKDALISFKKEIVKVPISYQNKDYYLAISKKYFLSLSEGKISSVRLKMKNIFRVREIKLQEIIQEIVADHARVGTASFH